MGAFKPSPQGSLRAVEALFIISVASRLVAMHPATLRKYERVGFLEPSRSTGNVRLYSRRDIARLRQIKYLVDERGMNLAGVELALELTQCLQRLWAQLQQESGATVGLDTTHQLIQQALTLLGAEIPDNDGNHLDWRT